MRNPIRLARLALSVLRLIRDLGRLEQVLEINDHIVALRTPAGTLGGAHARFPVGLDRRPHLARPLAEVRRELRLAS